MDRQISETDNDNNWEELAAQDFEPWKLDENSWEPPSNDEWVDAINPVLVSARIAYAAVQKPKPQLIDIMAAMSEEAGTALLDRMQYSIEYLQAMLTVLEAAQGRIICAGLNVKPAEEKITEDA